jgi:rod shape determining protein RodA
MKFRLGQLFSNIDWLLFGSALGLSVFGLVLIYSLTWPQENLFLRQLIFLGLGIAAFFIVQSFDRHFWRSISWPFYLIVLVLLVLLLVVGGQTHGARGWFYLGTLAFQPAEFAKIACIIFWAATLERLNFDIANWRHLLRVVFWVALPVGLVLFQPDFGSAFIMGVVGAVMVLYTGLDRRKFMLLTLALIIVAATGWGLLHDYQRARVATFLNPRSDPLGAGYNVRQSIVAIGSGGLFGRGLGLGTQSQLNFLPEQETDFIFASLAEELGFVGASVVFVLYLLLLRRIYRLIKEGENLFTNFLLLGIFTMLVSESVINIGMNMGIFPVTGITLPFVSYGGSSLLASWLGLGLVQNARK